MRDALTRQGATSSAAFLRHRMRLSPGEASACARTARVVRATAAETGAACAAGQVTAAQAAVIARAVAELPAGPVQAAAERSLLEHAATVDPVLLGRLARRIAAHVGSDADDAAEAAALARAEQRAARRTDLSLVPDRDRGCAFPGCDRPPGWCDAHHIRHWADGGATSLANGVLPCGTHHRLVEHGDGEVRLAADGRPEFHPPPWVDPAGAPAAIISTTPLSLDPPLIVVRPVTPGVPAAEVRLPFAEPLTCPRRLPRRAARPARAERPDPPARAGPTRPGRPAWPPATR